MNLRSLLRLLSQARRRQAVVVVGLLALCAPAVGHASDGSILPSSLRTVAFGPQAYPADLNRVGFEPCALISRTGAHGTGAILACGARLQQRRSPTVHAPKHVRLNEFDVVAASHLSFVGYSTRTAQSDVRSPILIRTELTGTPATGWGRNSVADLASLKPEGLQSVALGNVDAAQDGGTIVAGVAGRKRQLRGFVAKVDANGHLDTSFGTDGSTVIDVPGYRRSFPISMRVMDDGRILVVGWASAKPEGSFVAFAALLDAAGAPVAGFGRGGVATPRLGANSALTSLPAEGGATFPMPVSGSSNRKGAVRSWVVRLTADGTLEKAGSRMWGGPASIPVARYVGHERSIQQLDIERRDDGSVVGAAELVAEGDWDTFVTRFHPQNGKPDTAYSNRGYEPIDVVPGVEDDEWTQSIASGPGGSVWVLGGHTRGKRDRVHLFRTIGKGSSSTARFPASWIGMILHNDHPATCGYTAKKACVVKAGARIEVAYSVRGPERGNVLVRPWLVQWSKPAGRRTTWKRTESTSRTWVNGGYVNGRRFYRVPRGTHQFFVRRNGTATRGPAWYGPLHVRAR